MRTLLNRLVIGVFLALVVGVVILQVTSNKDVSADVTPPAEEQQVDEQPAEDPAQFAAGETCGDRVCNGTESCSSCMQDCGMCTQTYCCQVENHSCDGPFGVPENVNPCDHPGYAKFLYSFPNSSTELREQAYNSCLQTCGDSE